jgi:hypothetical protein
VVINQCVFEICAQRNLLPSFDVAAGICYLHMQTLQGCDTRSVHTICANKRLRTFASHGLGPRKLARRCLRACSKDEGGRWEALSPMSSESESGREALRNQRSGTGTVFRQIERSARFHSGDEVVYDLRWAGA